MSEKHTVVQKYFSKFFSSIFGYILSLSVMGIVPRSLGVINYGNFNYCTSVLTKFLNLLDFRASTFFYTKISQNNHNKDLLNFFGKFILVIFLFSFIIVFIFLKTGLSNIYFPELGKKLILISLIYVQLSYIQDVYISLMDAAGLTIKLEFYRIISKLAFIISILLLFKYKSLDIYSLFYAYFISFILYIIILRENLRKQKINLFKHSFKNLIKLSKTVKEFIKYSSPLALYLILTFVADFFDRSVLQLYGGSFEQGIYSFSFMISNLCFLVISPMFPIFTRELSILSINQDVPEMSKLFRKFVPLLFTTTSILCCFLFNHTDFIIKLVGGNEYKYSDVPLRVLLFFPLFSVYSMLNASVIYSNSKTKILLIVSLVLLPLGMISTYFLVGNAKWCLNLGATGLALKTIFFELTSVIIILYINSKYLKIEFYKYIIHIIATVFVFLSLGFLTKYLSNKLFTNGTVEFFSAGIFYLISSMLLFLFFPKIFGMNNLLVKRLLNNIS
jgi:O-antigen/teichoic acid export membrane protein